MECDRKIRASLISSRGLSADSAASHHAARDTIVTLICKYPAPQGVLKRVPATHTHTQTSIVYNIYTDIHIYVDRKLRSSDLAEERDVHLLHRTRHNGAATTKANREWGAPIIPLPRQPGDIQYCRYLCPTCVNISSARSSLMSNTLRVRFPEGNRAEIGIRLRGMREDFHIELSNCIVITSRWRNVYRFA